MDGSWTNIANAFMKPRLGAQLDELDSLFSRFDLPPGRPVHGWYQYFDRDIRALLGKQVPSPFKARYCGNGNLEKLPERRSGRRSPPRATRSLPSRAPPTRPQWRSDANRERIHFPRAAREDDAVHEPPERDPAGDLVRRPPPLGRAVAAAHG